VTSVRCFFHSRVLAREANGVHQALSFITSNFPSVTPVRCFSHSRVLAREANGVHQALLSTNPIPLCDLRDLCAMLSLFAGMPSTFLYFAYGSNMFARRLAARTPSALRITTAFVEGRRLTFDKVSTDGSGKCDIVATGNPADRVYGVLFRIATAEEHALDEAEGLGHGYRKDEIIVVTFEGTLVAATYLATKKDPKCRPYDWYKAFVLQGAIENALPAAYIDLIRAVPSQTDPDTTRRARNEALLAGFSQ
jgi:gamma-glutamylcyclotransferase